jgi:uncharacterized protein YcbK (DUF882 family)
MGNEETTRAGCMLIVGGFILIVALLYGFGVMGMVWNRLASPVQEETRRQSYDQSRTYQQGMAVDLDELCRQWRTATDVQTKAGLADTIRLRAAPYRGELPPQVTRCLEEIR